MAARDEFSSTTIRALASRVAWRCSAPQCRRPTIGPKNGDNLGFVTAGEAAHITAAAPNGPRYDSSLTKDQRINIGNGIWLCSNCADIIDKDHLNYSAETLRQWRALAERDAHESLVGPGVDSLLEPTTLVAFGFNIVVSAIWLGGSIDRWRFGIKRFILGDDSALRNFIEGGTGDVRFVTVESQGDGRLLTGTPEWEYKTDTRGSGMVVVLPVLPRHERADPRELGIDLALLDGDLVVENGDLALVEGLDHAKQRIWAILSEPYQSSTFHPDWGSRWRDLAEAHRDDLVLLGRLLLLDMARLVNIPVRTINYMHSARERTETMEAQLGFVERVESVLVLNLDWVTREIRVQVTLRWAATRERWQAELTVPLPCSGPPPPSPSETDSGP